MCLDLILIKLKLKSFKAQIEPNRFDCFDFNQGLEPARNHRIPGIT